jgi:hypothetical protein
VSSAQAIGNNGGVAVPLAVDGSGAVAARPTGALIGAAQVFDGVVWVPLACDAAGRPYVRLTGQTSGGVAVTVRVNASGALVVV